LIDLLAARLALGIAMLSMAERAASDDDRATIDVQNATSTAGKVHHCPCISSVRQSSYHKATKQTLAWQILSTARERASLLTTLPLPLKIAVLSEMQ